MQLSLKNNTESPLLGGQTFIGEYETAQKFQLSILVHTDAPGTLYIDYTNDGTKVTRHPANGYEVRANQKEWKVTVQLGHQFRLVYENGTTDQTFLTLNAYFGKHPQSTVAVEDIIDPDTAAIVVRNMNEIDLARGKYSYAKPFAKFGTNRSVGTSIVPVTDYGSYAVPQTAVSLEVLSTDANDTAAGTGARSITVFGLDENSLEISQTVNLNGITPVPLPINMRRVYRVLVASSGTYATATAGSHVGTITVRQQGTGTVFGQLGFISGFPVGQSLIGVYSVPADKILFLRNVTMSVNTSRVVSFALFVRNELDQTAPPYEGMRIQRFWEQVNGTITDNEVVVYPPKTDIGFMALASNGTNSASVSFKGVLFDN